jgi:pyruvate dehydrogenase E2 component (dihydrolipoamide acetyltransferase)
MRFVVAIALGTCLLATPALAADAPPSDPFKATDPDFAAAYVPLYLKTWGPGKIPAKYKQLTGISLSLVKQCDDCLDSHIHQAVALGATKGEILEAMRIGLMTGGSVALPTLLKGYALLDTLHVPD